MKQHGIWARTKRKFVVVATDSKHSLPVAPDLVQRRFNPVAPNQLWSGDIPYIATDEGGCTWLRSSTCFVGDVVISAINLAELAFGVGQVGAFHEHATHLIQTGSMLGNEAVEGGRRKTTLYPSLDAGA
jgi:hypothetical protein